MAGRLAHWLKGAASLGAGGLGAMLLLADTSPEHEDCPTLAPFKAEFDFVTDCEALPAQGHVVLDWQGGDPAEAGAVLATQLRSSGLDASSAVASCKEGSSALLGIVFGELGVTRSVICSGMTIPWLGEQPVPCTEREPADAGLQPMPTACTFIVTASAAPP